MPREHYQGDVNYEGADYTYSAIVDRPNEITTLVIQGSGLEKELIAHGLIFSKPINWKDDKERKEFLARVVSNHITLDREVISKLHREVVTEYNKEAI